jgi:hypothetical protein
VPSYEVVEACYIPLGEGVRYKLPGQVVTLTVAEAKDLDGYVERLGPQGVANPFGGVTVRNPDTGVTVRNPDTPAAPSKPQRGAGVTMDEEVDSHAGGSDQAGTRTPAKNS